MRLPVFFLAFLFLLTPLPAQVILSEFLAANSNSIVDEDGEHEDWIEVANTGATGVNLLGWYLTDDAGEPRKWAFPSKTLNGGAYLVIFASDKDRRNPAANLHTNFKLSASPGYLALTRDVPGGGIEVVQAFAPYPQQATDVAYGAAITTTITPLIGSGAAAKTLVPTVGNGGDLLAETWRGGAANEPFDDGTWIAGTTPVGFPNAGVVPANLKLRLNAHTAAALATDTSGAAHSGSTTSVSWNAETVDGSGRARHGTMQFNATDANGAATGDQMIVPTSHADFSSASGTLSFWIKTAGNIPDGGNVQGAMFFDRRSGTGVAAAGMGIYLADDGTLKFAAGNGASLLNSVGSTVAVKDDRWHHVALVFNRNAAESCTFYIDGAAAGTQVNTAAWSVVFSQQIELGRSHDNYWRRLNGQLDDFRLYNAALTPAQIGLLFSEEDEPVTVGTNVTAAMQNVNASAFVRVAFNVADPAAFPLLNLTMRWSDGFVAWLNGTPVAAFGAPGALAFDAVATQPHSAGAPFVTGIANASALLRAGTNILAVQALNDTAANGVFSMLPVLEASNTVVAPGGYLVTPTPGAANSAAKTNLGPFVSGVTKNPNPRPTGTAGSPPLTINATVVPSLRPLAASNPVQLKYLVMFAPAETTVNMTLTAPNVYTAQIPTATLGAGQMLRWRVVATDNTAVAGTAPEYSDPLDNERYHGTVAVDSTIQTSLPVLYFFVADTTAPNNGTGTRCSFFYKAIGETGVGRFYDNVEANLHGQSSAGFNKKSYDLDFNEDNRFEWNVANERVKDVNLMTNWGDKAKTHNQMTHEALAAIGSVHHWCHQVRVQQVTTANAATPANHFFSIADLMEDGDDDFMERNGRDPEGALYKIYDSLGGTGSAEKKTRTHEDKSDLQALINGLNTGSSLTLRRQYGYDNLDLPQCVSYFVGLAIASSQDHGHKNFYVYRDSVGTREWCPLPWDVDLTWGRNWLDANGYFTDTIFTNNDLDMYNSSQQGKGENRLYSLIVGNSDVGRAPAPEIRNMVLRRLRTVMDGYFSAPNVLENRFAQLADLMDPPSVGTSDADRDYTKWGTWGSDGGNTAGGTALRYHINQIRNVYLPGRRTFLNTATIAGVAVPASQPANAANLLTLETVDFNPASGTQEHEYFLIRNANTYAVDVSGWQITGAVNHTFKPGTVIPSGGGTTENIGHLFVAKNPWLFRQRAVSPKAGQFCFVQGPYSGQLSARGETIELRDAAGTLLKTKTWTPAPTALQNQLRVTELNYAPVAPTPAESAALPGVTKGDFEFIELANIGTTALTLTGATFDKGVTFTFPAFTLAAGARCLVVANLAAFQLRHGHAFDTQIAGVFTGNFDDGGETVQLLDNVGESILEFTYDNAWFPPSDEGGRSLVARSTSPDWAGYNTPSNWALSGNVNGSPGAGDADFANVYEGWRHDYFTAAEFPTVGNPFAPAAVSVDAENDLLINLAEYAFGGNPRVRDHRALATPGVVNVGGTDYCAIVFTRRHLALDLAYTVEVSGDLLIWNAVDLPVGAPVDLGGGLEQVTYRDNVPAGIAPRFLRVRAVK